MGYSAERLMPEAAETGCDPKDVLYEQSQRLSALNKELVSGKLTRVAYAKRREQCVAAMLRAMAEDCGISLKGALYIDANGEFSIVVAHPDPAQREFAGEYGDQFARWLSTVPRRTGEQDTDTPALPENGWCRLNHFQAENLVLAYVESLTPDEREQETIKSRDSRERP